VFFKKSFDFFSFLGFDKALKGVCHMAYFSKRKQERGQGMVEFIIAFPILLLLLVSFYEVSRMMVFKVALESAAYEMASQLAASDIILEENHQWKSNGEPEDSFYRELRANLQDYLRYLPALKMALGEDGTLNVFRRYPIRLYVEKREVKGEMGFAVKINGCVPLFSFFHMKFLKDSYQDIERTGGKDCLGQFGISAITSTMQIPVRTFAFVPKGVYDSIYKKGHLVPKKPQLMSEDGFYSVEHVQDYIGNNNHFNYINNMNWRLNTIR